MPDLSGIARQLVPYLKPWFWSLDLIVPDVGARVYYASGAQSIATATQTALAFDNETYDTANFHDNSTNNSRLTIPYTGKYSISASVEFAANATGARGVYLRVDGATFIAGNVGPGNATLATTLSVEAKYAFSAGQYVECTVFQNSGGNLNVNRTADYSPIFAIHRLP